MDGSTKTNVHMIRATYDELIKEGFRLRYIVVTHPDLDHYGGIKQVLGFNDVDSPQVLLTNRFSDRIKSKMFGEQYIQVQSLTPPIDWADWPPQNIENKCFNVSHRSFTSDLVLYRTKQTAADDAEQPIILQLNGTFKKPERKRDNESSIITTITMNSDGNIKTLACLTGDAFFDTSEIVAQFLRENKIKVFQVPHHGSEDNSNCTFYEQIAENTQYYLISCGKHQGYGHPKAEVFTAIRNATVSGGKEGATIVLTDGTNLNGEKVFSFTGHDYEPFVSYWDPHLRDCELINKDCLQFTFSGEGNLVSNSLQNLTQWSITGYREMADRYVLRQTWRRIQIHLKAPNRAPNNRHFIVMEKALTTEECQGDECTASIDGFLGLPAPTNPCTWDDRVIMVDGTDDLVFLQLATKGKIYYQACNNVKNEIENILKSGPKRISKLKKKAKDFYENVPLLSTALTNFLFRGSTAAQKFQLIQKIKTKLNTGTYDVEGMIDGDNQIATHVRNFLQIVLDMKRILITRSSYTKKLKQKYNKEIETIKAGIGNLLLAIDHVITSLDDDYSTMVFFKCHKVPWQIVYGTISNTGEVDWLVQYAVCNSLQTYTS